MLSHIALSYSFQYQVHAEERRTTLEGFDFTALMWRLHAEEKSSRSKAEILALLQSTGEKWADWVGGLTESFLAERVSFGPGLRGVEEPVRDDPLGQRARDASSGTADVDRADRRCGTTLPRAGRSAEGCGSGRGAIERRRTLQTTGRRRLPPGVARVVVQRSISAPQAIVGLACWGRKEAKPRKLTRGCNEFTAGLARASCLAIFSLPFRALRDRAKHVRDSPGGCMHYSAMKLRLTIAAMTSALAVAAQPVVAQNAPIAGGVVGQVSQWKGVVISLDTTTRVLVVKGPHGTLHAFTVRKQIPNLHTVKKGDSLTVDYVEAIAVYLREATDPPVAGTVSSTTVKPTGMPAVTDVQVTEVQANVTAIDAATRTLTVRGPQGNLRKMQVDSSVHAFSKVKVGDQIVVRYTQSLAVAVTK